MISKYTKEDGKFDLVQFCKDNPGIKNWAKYDDHIRSNVFCRVMPNAKCVLPRYDLYVDGGLARCKHCNRKYVYIIPYRKNKDDIRWATQSGWYVQSPGFVDIIKSWFKLLV